MVYLPAPRACRLCCFAFALSLSSATASYPLPKDASLASQLRASCQSFRGEVHQQPGRSEPCPETSSSWTPLRRASLTIRHMQVQERSGEQIRGDEDRGKTGGRKWWWEEESSAFGSAGAFLCHISQSTCNNRRHPGALRQGCIHGPHQQRGAGSVGTCCRICALLQARLSRELCGRKGRSPQDHRREQRPPPLGLPGPHREGTRGSCLGWSSHGKRIQTAHADTRSTVTTESQSHSPICFIHSRSCRPEQVVSQGQGCSSHRKVPRHHPIQPGAAHSRTPGHEGHLVSVSARVFFACSQLIQFRMRGLNLAISSSATDTRNLSLFFSLFLNFNSPVPDEPWGIISVKAQVSAAHCCRLATSEVPLRSFLSHQSLSSSTCLAPVG